MSTSSRRQFLALAGTGLAAAALWARVRTRDVGPTAAAPAGPASEEAPVAPPPPPPPPPPPRGREAPTLLPETPWATPAVAIHSGQAGPRVMVLGGVHGNEPGAWEAAEAIAEWELARGSLLVVPRANHLAAAALQRTLPGFGDLNRLYPGDPGGAPMARMAAEIVAVARRFQPDLLVDLHESWGFYAERGTNGGTAFIGQTVAVGVSGEAMARIAGVVDVVNAQIPPREQILLRTSRAGAGAPAGGSSSLSLGNWVPNCVPVLVEMGQEDQPEERRAELHQLFVRILLERSAML